MKRKLIALMALATLSAFNFQLSTARAQGTAFTYQGQLANNGLLASGSYDLKFTLFATNSAGLPVAGPVTNTATAVSNGLFTVTIDFGAGVFTGGSNWLEIGVRTNGVGGFTTLAPRQQITPTPYAITAGGVTGAIPLAQLPSTLVTNDASGVNLSGAFSGNGSGLTNLAAAIAAVNGAGTNTTLTNANIAATNVLIGGPANLTYVQSGAASSEAMFVNLNNNSNCINLGAPNGIGGEYASLRFTWINTGPPVTVGDEVAAIGISTQKSQNFSQPYPGQSNYGIYMDGTLYFETDGGDAWAFAGTGVHGATVPTAIPEFYMESNHYGLHITDWATGYSNIIDFNRTNFNLYINYGALITSNVYATNVTAGTFSGNGAGLTNIPFSGIQSNGGVYFPSNSFTLAQITNGLSAGGGWIGMISNVLWSYKLSNNIVVSNRLN